jgi:hypothetical protein
MAFTIARRRKIYMGLTLLTAFLTASVANELDCANCEGGASERIDMAAPFTASGLSFGTAIAQRVDSSYFGTPVSLNTGFYADPSADFLRNLSAYAAPPLENPAYMTWNSYMATAPSIFAGTSFAAVSGTPVAPAWTVPTFYSVLPQ